MTENQRQKNETAVKYLLLIMLLFALIAGLTSCATNGYGCKGRSKLITRVKQ